ncbi:MAG: AI-2E family transporter [Polyangiaceae bacterium]
MTILDPRQQERAFQWLALVMVAAAVVVFVPVWAALVLAIWVAVMTRPLVVRIARALGGRGRAAGVLVLAFVISIALPLVATVIALVQGADTLVQGLMHSSGAKSAFVALVSHGDGGGDEASLDLLKSPQRIMELIERHGGQALTIASGIAGAATKAIIGLCIFLYALFAFLVDGPGWYRWLLDHSPFERRKAERMAAAFNETGRGLFVGVGLTLKHPLISSRRSVEIQGAARGFDGRIA